MLQNLQSVEVTESRCVDCRCDLARCVRLQETRWPTFRASEMPSEAQCCGTHYQPLGYIVYSGLPDVEPRCWSHAVRSVPSLNTRHNGTHRGQAIKISECPQWLMVVTMVTE